MSSEYWENFKQSAIDRWNQRSIVEKITLNSTPEIITEVPEWCKLCGFHPINHHLAYKELVTYNAKNKIEGME